MGGQILGNFNFSLVHGDKISWIYTNDKYIYTLNVSWNNLLMMWICGWGHEDGPKKSTKIELPRILIIPQYLINYNFWDGFSSIQQCTVTVFKEQNHKIYLHGLDTV